MGSAEARALRARASPPHPAQADLHGDCDAPQRARRPQRRPRAPPVGPAALGTKQGLAGSGGAWVEGRLGGRVCLTTMVAV